MLCYWGSSVSIKVAPQSLLLCSRSCDDSRLNGWWVALAADQQGRVGTIEEAPMRSFAPRSCQTEVRVLSDESARTMVSELAGRFAKTSGYVVTVDFAADAETRRRIEADEPFDVAIIDPTVLDALIQAGKLTATTRTMLGTKFAAALARTPKEPEAAQELLRAFAAGPFE
jgi:ABC-type molybdate transport system substrate-binding protein